MFGSIGIDVEIDTPIHCNYGQNIFIGSHVIINMNCTFVVDKEIRIGDYVLIASNVQIYTASHPILPKERLNFGDISGNIPFFRTFAQPVEIQDNVWIGGGSIILPGVTIGKNSTIEPEVLLRALYPKTALHLAIHAEWRAVLRIMLLIKSTDI